MAHIRQPDPPELTAHLNHCRLRNLSEKTITERRYGVLSLHRFLTARHSSLLTATETDLEDFQVTFANRRPNGRSNMITHLRGFYQWAVWAELIAADPTGRLVKPKLGRRLPRPMGRRDVEAALRFAPRRVRPWLLLAVGAGLRAAEIAQLNREDIIDTTDPPVVLVHGKGGKDRIVPLPEGVLAEIRSQPRHGPLWPRLDGRPGQVSANIVSEQCNRYLHSIGITSTLHTLRHRAATDWYEASQHDLLLVQNLLGHASPATTAIYAAYSKTRAADVVRQVGDRLLSPQTSEDRPYQ